VNTLDLILHPVRLRILHAMSGGRTRTTSDLCASLPNVSKPTVYRQVALLVEGGLLEVMSEQRVRGAVERRYRLHRARAVIDGDIAASMSLEDHRRGFAAAMAGLAGEFNAYLDRGHADPTADSVGYRQIPLRLTRGELNEVIDQVRSIVMPRMENQRAHDRRLYLLSPIIFPIEDGTRLATDEHSE
jgi:DNA-binding transcriptional ArsR family regulator